MARPASLHTAEIERQRQWQEKQARLANEAAGRTGEHAARSAASEYWPDQS